MKTLPDFATDISLALAAHGPVTVDLIETTRNYHEVCLLCPRAGLSVQIFKTIESFPGDSCHIDLHNKKTLFDGSFENAVKFLDNL